MLISGGGRRELTSLYNNIGGSRKTTYSAFANISGTRKQIYPTDTTITYTYRWKRYKYETGIQYDITGPHQDGDSENSSGAGTAKFGSNYTVSSNASAGTITVSLTGIKEYERTINGFYGFEPAYALYTGVNNAAFAVKSSYTFTPTKANPNSALVYIGWVTSCNRSTFTAEYYYRVICTSLDGQTKVFDKYVTSTNRNAYPDAGDSGSYYYEFYDQY